MSRLTKRMDYGQAVYASDAHLIFSDIAGHLFRKQQLKKLINGVIEFGDDKFDEYIAYLYRDYLSKRGEEKTADYSALLTGRTFYDAANIYKLAIAIEQDSNFEKQIKKLFMIFQIQTGNISEM